MKETEQFSNVAFYLDMGLGKTFVASEKGKQLNKWLTIVVCQKSLIETWFNHYKSYYPNYHIMDMTEAENMRKLHEDGLDVDVHHILIVNYDLLFRRNIFLNLSDYCLILDESSVIQNESAKRTKFVLKMQPSNVILLSGTPTSGKYENLWTQINLLGWSISKNLYEKQYVNWKKINAGGFIRKVPDSVDPYKNVDRLKSKMRLNGAIFMKTEEVFDLPEQTITKITIPNSEYYQKFDKESYVAFEGDEIELIGDTTLTKRLYLRQLASQYNTHKFQAFEDLLTGTNDRLVVFYNFNDELEGLLHIAQKHKRPISIINGQTKDLSCYETCDDSITFIQYQAGAMGLNLQKANKIIYFSLTEKSELFEQSKKRIHRIGQNRPCFYYILETKKSIDEDIYRNLEMRRDYTDELFRESQQT